MVLLLAAAARAADCPAPLPATSLDERLTAAEQAFAALDPDAFVAATEAMAVELPCLSERVPPALAARVHRIRALQLWGAGAEDAARGSLGALRRVEPGAQLPTDLVPSGHPLHGAMMTLEAPRLEALPEPLSGTLWLDGGSATERAANQPTIAQLDVDGQIRWTALVHAGEPLPAYEAKPTKAAGGAPSRTVLFTAAGASLAGAGAAFAGASLAASGFQRYEPPPDASGQDAFSALQSRRTTANALTVGAGTLTAAAVGLATAAVLR